MTALHWACKRGNYSIVKFLLLCHSNPNARDKDRRTPLYYAIVARSPRIFRRLLVAGARPFDDFNEYLLTILGLGSKFYSVENSQKVEAPEVSN